MFQGLGDQALDNVLSCPPEQRVPELGQFAKFVLGQRMSVFEARSLRSVGFISKTHVEILRD